MRGSENAQRGGAGTDLSSRGQVAFYRHHRPDGSVTDPAPSSQDHRLEIIDCGFDTERQLVMVNSNNVRGWLVLSRGLEQEILICTPEGEVMIKVIELRDDNVRLAIDAPKQIPVDRREVYEAKLQTRAVAPPNKDAARDSATATEGTFR